MFGGTRSSNEVAVARYALGIAYVGTHWAGWQSQSNALGIQPCVEAALSKVADESVIVTASGRTDSGVHALGQVVHFDSSAVRTVAQWRGGANAELSSDIRVLWVRKMPAPSIPADGLPFHARHDALDRSYLYLLENATVASPHWHDQTSFCSWKLDVPAMQEAARYLLGTHDFAAFRSSRCHAKTTIRTMHSIRLLHFGQLLGIHLTGSAFLQKMVRIIVGSLLQVGKGRQPATWLREILVMGDRTKCAATAPAKGLHYLGPRYAPELGLPPRPVAENFMLASAPEAGTG